MTLENLLKEEPHLAPYVGGLPAAAARNATLRTFAPHTVIHQKDEPLDSFGIVCRGAIRAVNEFENGNIYMVEKSDAVCFVGEVALLAGEEKSSVTIQTLTECRVLFLPRADFEAWIAADPSFLRLLCQSVAQKLYHSTYSKGERQYHSTRYLLLKYLLEQVEELGPGHPWPARIAKTRRQMSEEVGLVVKTLDRLIAALREEGVVSVQRGKVCLTQEQHRLAGARAREYQQQGKQIKTT